jgi:hypothetical protein
MYGNKVLRLVRHNSRELSISNQQCLRFKTTVRTIVSQTSIGFLSSTASSGTRARALVNGESHGILDKSTFSVERNSFMKPTSLSCLSGMKSLKGLAPLVPYPIVRDPSTGRDGSTLDLRVVMGGS